MGLGGTTAAVSYGTSLGGGLFYILLIYPFQYVFAHTKPEPAMLWLMVPVAGPFLAASSEHVRDDKGLRTTMYVIGGLQVAGLAMLTFGLILKASSRSGAETASLKPKKWLAFPGAGTTPFGASLYVSL